VEWTDYQYVVLGEKRVISFWPRRFWFWLEKDLWFKQLAKITKVCNRFCKINRKGFALIKTSQNAIKIQNNWWLKWIIRISICSHWLMQKKAKLIVLEKLLLNWGTILIFYDEDLALNKKNKFKISTIIPFRLELQQTNWQYIWCFGSTFIEKYVSIALSAQLIKKLSNFFFKFNIHLD
jgi:hypothetical protein